MTTITESQLLDRVKGLKEYMGLTEANVPQYKTPQEYDAEIKRFSSKNNMAYQMNKDYVTALQNAKAALAGQSQKPATAPATAPAKPAAKPDPNVKALQDKLIAAGAKIKADGIMGPATRAAQAQFPNVTTQTDAEKAVGVDINSAEKGPGMATGADMDIATQDAGSPAPATPAPAAPAPAAPAKAADGGPPPTPEQLKWLGGADQNDPIILSRMRKAVPNAPAAATPAPAPATPAPAPATPAPAAGTTPVATLSPEEQKASQQAQASVGGSMTENVGYDEVQRLVSLVQYR